MMERGTTIFSLVITLMSCVGSSEVPSHERGDPRIVGGNPATFGQLPYQVFVITEVSTGQKLCGGSIIAEDYILTAAHCTTYAAKPSDLWIGAGNLELTRKEPTIKKTVSKIYVHEKYKTGSYDIALLKLETKLDLSSPGLKSVSLQSNSVAPGKQCIVSGWGDTAWEGDNSQVLLYVSLPIVSSEVCSQQLGIKIADDQLCAGVAEGGKGSCQGDSGGPLVCDNYLTGIVSRGVKCAEPNKPGIYTNVPHLKKWIEDKIKYGDGNGNASAVHSLNKFLSVIMLTALIAFWRN